MAVSVPTDVRARLQGIAEATDDLLHALDAAGIRSAAQQSPQYNLHSLDRRLPKRSVFDLLLACETLATVTGPTLLASGKERDLQSQTQPLLDTVRHIARVTQGRSVAGASGSTLQMSGLLLHSAFADPDSQNALARLIQQLSAVATVEGGQTKAKHFSVRIGTRFLVPGSVIAITLALIIFFLSGIAFATGAITLSQNGVALTTLQNTMATQTAASHTGAAATANSQHSTSTTQQATPASPANSQATATPPPGKKPTPPPSTPTLSVSPAQIQPCAGTDAQFALARSGGSGSITWHATSPDAANIALSVDGTSFAPSVSGSLDPGGNVTIYVRLLNDVQITGIIPVSGSSGVSGTSVNYTSMGC